MAMQFNLLFNINGILSKLKCNNGMTSLRELINLLGIALNGLKKIQFTYIEVMTS